ncbi:cytochrome c550 [Sporosarcina sp. YIM B06819]|uniref:cytochrome c550 n=1 Tax=Sporosarcina sp. YIM B06819 TaxID=3081769 RepID=UPI00298BC9D7|nr:cytochrome c [Sporosarcina sp. YIM B06819]
MGKNPVVPYILIFALGLGLIFFMSLYGLDQQKEIANKGEEGKTEDVAESAEFDPEVAVGKCIGCHGGDLTGGMGGAAPSLVGTSLSKDEIKNVILNGSGAMPAGIIKEDAELDAMADYILSLK